MIIRENDQIMDNLDEVLQPFLSTEISLCGLVQLYNFKINILIIVIKMKLQMPS